MGTLYDPFIERGLDALNYACYQDARFMVAATPSGITLAPEGGAHQSIATPLIAWRRTASSSFEPAFGDELAVIMRWGFDHMQRDDDGGSVYLRLSTRTLDQPQRTMTPELASDIAAGAYWLRKPGPNAELVIAYTGAVAPEAIEATGFVRRVTPGHRPACDHVRGSSSLRLERIAQASPQRRAARTEPYRAAACAVARAIAG